MSTMQRGCTIQYTCVKNEDLTPTPQISELKVPDPRVNKVFTLFYPVSLLYYDLLKLKNMEEN